MHKEIEKAEPSPSLSCKFDECLPMIQHLSLTEKGESMKEQKDWQHISTKKINKPLTRKYKAGTTRKNDNKKTKIIMLEKKIAELKTQIDKLNRKIENCSLCQRSKFHQKTEGHFKSDFNTHSNPCQSQIKRMATTQQKFNENAGCSMEFQNIDFSMKGMYSKQMDEFSWVYLGTLMIAMGSCCTDFDGNMNVFKVQKQSVDALRRQVEKSQQKISMDFFMNKETLTETANCDDEIGFDPFINKVQPPQGLILDTVKVESVQQFQLFYDNKVTFKLRYQALIAAMEYIRQHCWISMEP